MSDGATELERMKLELVVQRQRWVLVSVGCILARGWLMVRVMHLEVNWRVCVKWRVFIFF